LTLLQIIYCLDRPTSGRYRLSGRDIDQLEADELAKIRNRHIGFVFQSYTLLPRVSVVDKVALPLRYRGLDWRDAKYKAMEALAKVGAEDLSDRTSNQLSGGQQQRVAIARAIIGQPDIVLADEPTGALERQSGDHIMEIFAQLNDAGMTVLAITHDDHVAGYCKQRFTMSEGCLQSDPGTARPTVGDASFS
jgi:putative ABC transport system ATP-binding protein